MNAIQPINKKLNAKKMVFMKVYKWLLLIVIGMMLPLGSLAQQTNDIMTMQQKHLGTVEKSVSLDQTLRQLEEAYDVNIFYNSQEVDGKSVNKINRLFPDIKIHLSLLLESLDMTYRELTETSFVVYQKEQPKDQQAIQQETVSGSVTDLQSGETLPGVNVMVKGTTTGTSTDTDGTFELTVESLQDTLIFSFVGYQTQEVPINGRTEIDIVLQSQAIAGEEVVVVGYGTQRASNITGSVATVSSQDLEDRLVTSFSEALAGQVAGAQIQQTSAQPGGGIQIRIRGTGSITAGNTPLYVIDGVPLDNTVSSSQSQGTFLQQPVNSLAGLNPNDIESINILKDASATAIYGSRGSNGVVIINTKRGVPGQSEIQLKISTGWQDIADNKIPIVSKEVYAQKRLDAINNNWIRRGGQASDPNSDRPFNRRIPLEFSDPSRATYTDWQDVVFRTAPMENYELSASGGSEDIQYFVSGSHVNQKGIVKGSGYKKYSFRGNLDADISDKIQVGFRIAPSFSDYGIARSEGIPWSGGLISNLLNTDPYNNPYNDDGSYASSFTFNYEDGQTNTNGYLNPLANSEGMDRDLGQFRTVGNLYTSVDLLENLEFRSSLSVDLNVYNKDQFWPSYIGIYGSLPPRNPYAESFTSRNTSWINENTLNYENTLNEEHTINVLLGFTAQESQFQSKQMSATGFPNDRVHTLNAGIVDGGSTFESDWTLLSILGRVNYDYENKYLLTMTARRDGSSRFGANNKWGFFPSGSVGWRITEEDFMNSIPFISELKLRVSYGLTGNNQIPDYAPIGLVGSANYILGEGSGSIANGLAQSTISNPDLTWEKAKEYNLGLELGLFNNRIYLSTDYYNKVTSDLLLDVPVPYSTGFSNALTNIGEVSNKGVEIQLNTRNVQRNYLTWTTGFNISFNKNNVEALGLHDDPILVAPLDVHNSLAYKTEVGKPMGMFYGYVYEGVFLNQEEVDSYPHFNGTTPGDAKFRDVNGDGQISVDDKTIIGDNHPDFIYGFTSRLSYRNFGLNVIIQGLQGAQVFNYLGRGAMYRYIASYYEDYWRSPEEPGDGQTFKEGGIGTNRSISSWYVQDGSYLRIKNVTLSYTLPQNLFANDVFKRARLYFTIENLYTFTSYEGYNPDVNTVEGSTYHPSSLTPGIDYGTYPPARTMSLGLNITF